jgi:hypothetical protein
MVAQCFVVVSDLFGPVGAFASVSDASDALAPYRDIAFVYGAWPRHAPVQELSAADATAAPDVQSAAPGVQPAAPDVQSAAPDELQAAMQPAAPEVQSAAPDELQAAMQPAAPEKKPAVDVVWVLCFKSNGAVACATDSRAEALAAQKALLRLDLVHDDDDIKYSEVVVGELIEAAKLRLDNTLSALARAKRATAPPDAEASAETVADQKIVDDFLEFAKGQMRPPPDQADAARAEKRVNVLQHVVPRALVVADAGALDGADEVGV